MNSCVNNQPLSCDAGEGLTPCQPLDYGETAAYRFTLPGCYRGEKNDYVMFVIPQLKHDRRISPTCCSVLQPRPPDDDPVFCKQEPTVVFKNDEQDYSSPAPASWLCYNNRWSTEYRSTIDNCAKWMMEADICCKRRPIYPKQCLTNGCYCDEPAEFQPCIVESSHHQGSYEPCALKPEPAIMPCGQPLTMTKPFSKQPAKRIHAPPMMSHQPMKPCVHEEPILCLPKLDCERPVRKYMFKKWIPPDESTQVIVRSRRPLPRCKVADSNSCS